jgi:hypothetical protein
LVCDTSLTKAEHIAPTSVFDLIIQAVQGKKG